MIEYIKEVEKEVNFEDLVNRIYSADINDDARSSIVEVTFTSKDYLEKHLAEIEALSVHLSQPYYEKARMAIMKMHNMEELDNMSQQTQNLGGNSHEVSRKIEPPKESVHAPKPKPAKVVQVEDSYRSLDDIPDERFEPAVAQPQAKIAPIDQHGHGGNHIIHQKLEEERNVFKVDPHAPHHVAAYSNQSPPPKRQNNIDQWNAELGPEESDSDTVNKMMAHMNSPNPITMQNRQKIERQDSPPSLGAVPDERSYKQSKSENSRMKFANKELDDLLGLDHGAHPQQIARGGVEAIRQGNSVNNGPQESIHKIRADDSSSHKPKNMHHLNDQLQNSEAFQDLKRENVILKDKLDSLMKADAQKGGQPAAVKVLILENKLEEAENSMKALQEDNQKMRGEIEVSWL